MFDDERFERHRWAPAELLDVVISPLKDTILVVDRNFFQVLNRE
jgi:hypothetical protein